MVRVKSRYMLCEILHEGGVYQELPIDKHVVMAIIRERTQQLFGDYGCALVQKHFYVEYLNLATSMMVVKCKRERYEMVRTVLTLLTHLRRYPVIVHVLHVGGTIRSCYKFATRYHRRNLPSLLNECKTEDEKSNLMKVIEGTSVTTSKGSLSFMDSYLKQMQGESGEMT